MNETKKQSQNAKKRKSKVNIYRLGPIFFQEWKDQHANKNKNWVYT